jgi:uncharacterized protein YndB with AHSA1/START domain
MASDDAPALDHDLDTAATSAVVEERIELDAPITDVWAALTDPDQLGEWLGGDVELDVRPAGAGRVVDTDGTVRDVLVTAVDAHRRIAWHWWDERGDLSSVEITVEEVGPATAVRVVEVLVPSDGDEHRRVTACSRRWARATTELWMRLSTTAVARAPR